MITDINNLIGCAMSLLSGREADYVDGRVLSPQSADDMKCIAHDITEYLKNSSMKSEVEMQKLEHYKHTLLAISPFGSRYISNRHDHYFIVQCEFDFELLEDALEHETLDDMYDSMSIAHDFNRAEFESTAIIVREMDNNILACDLRGCWSPLTDKFAVRVEDWVDHYAI
jgi:hypothetical protein